MLGGVHVESRDTVFGASENDFVWASFDICRYTQRDCCINRFQRLGTSIKIYYVELIFPDILRHPRISGWETALSCDGSTYYEAQFMALFVVVRTLAECAFNIKVWLSFVSRHDPNELE